MNWDDFACAMVRIDCADMGKMNKIRAWARKNNAVVRATPYTKGAWEGTVKVPMPQGRDQQLAKVAELKAIIAA
jgi:hypothetical protein